jgi:cytochrome oxidase Cu insertion factor (SCO1/SenC/PrrC family)
VRHNRSFALIAAIVLLAGCGSQQRLSKTQYEQRVRSVYEDVRQAFRETKVGETQLAGRVGAAQSALRKAAQELDGVRPPSGVEEPNHDLAEAMREYAGDLDALGKAAAAHDTKAIARFNAQIPQNEAIDRIAEAAEEIRTKGYDLGPIATD